MARPVLGIRARLIFDWYHNEDHVYLAIYWCTAVGLSRYGLPSNEVLKTNARRLVGLAFLFACLWKITTPQFVDGSLCSYKLLADYRFHQALSRPILGLSDEQTQANTTALVSLKQTGSPLTSVQLQYPNSLIWAGRIMAVWTIVIEGAIAVLFLAPARWIKSQLRNGSLLVFTITTYLVVPVVGFGLLFATMGIAQTHARESRTRAAYLGISMLVLLRYVTI